MKQKILSDLYQSREMSDLIQKMQPEHLREEIKQELFLSLCEMPDQKIIGLHLSGGLKFFVTRVLLNMVQSSTSPFFKKYRRMITVDAGDFLPSTHDDEEEIIERETTQNALLEAVEKVLGEMHWYKRELFKLYVHHGSAGKVIKAMKADLCGKYIPRRTILDVVKQAKSEIKTKIQNPAA
jgi:hypothetical protein